MSVAVFRDGRVHIRAVTCDQCLFSRDRLVPGARARQIVADTRGTDGSAFVCHKSQMTAEPESICRGWWDRFAAEDPIMRLAVILGITTEVHP